MQLKPYPCSILLGVYSPIQGMSCVALAGVAYSPLNRGKCGAIDEAPMQCSEDPHAPHTALACKCSSHKECI